MSAIALWGRSMGAATALLHSHRDPTIACIVLDSPFADLRQLANVRGLGVAMLVIFFIANVWLLSTAVLRFAVDLF